MPLVVVIATYRRPPILRRGVGGVGKLVTEPIVLQYGSRKAFVYALDDILVKPVSPPITTIHMWPRSNVKMADMTSNEYLQ